MYNQSPYCCAESDRVYDASKKKILVADDDPGLRQLVAATLGADDFILLHAVNGDEAIAVALQQQPDLVLLDVNMPGRNGFEVCKFLKAQPSTAGIKVVMLTASGSEAERNLGRSVGADDYFVKPFSPLALLNKIYGLLSG